jgi:Heterokaryon incompatibility protein (HET)
LLSYSIILQDLVKEFKLTCAKALINSIGHGWDKKLPDQHIRILKVISDGKTFQAELEHFHVDHLPYFLALSWAWPKTEYGETLTSQSFLCNRKHFTIPTSLHKALLCLAPQSSPSSFRVWIDAICINQKDTAEKNVLVPAIGTVFGRANKVDIWLGEESDDSHMIMDEKLMKSIYRSLRKAEGMVLYGQLPDLGLPDESDPLWPAIGNLLLRRWFSRLWIVQEVVLAQKIERFLRWSFSALGMACPPEQ